MVSAFLETSLPESYPTTFLAWCCLWILNAIPGKAREREQAHRGGGCCWWHQWGLLTAWSYLSLHNKQFPLGLVIVSPKDHTSSWQRRQLLCLNRTMHHLISPACFLISNKYILSITAAQRCQILCTLDDRTLHVPEENADKSAKENKDLWRKEGC